LVRINVGFAVGAHSLANPASYTGYNPEKLFIGEYTRQEEAFGKCCGKMLFRARQVYLN